MSIRCRRLFGLREGGGCRPRRTAAKRLLPAAALVLTALFLALAEVRLSPLLAEAALDQAESRALLVLTEAAEQGIAAAGVSSYTDLVSIEHDSSGQVSLLMPDTVLCTKVINEATNSAVLGMNELSRQKLSLPLGAVSGSRLLAAAGPELKFRFGIAGNPQVKVEDEFTPAGITQVRHRLYLTLTIDIRVLLPFSPQQSQVATTVLLCEGVIVGTPPETYMELSGTPLSSSR